MAINKVVYNKRTLIDLSSDSVDAAHLAKGYTAHDKTGNTITGIMEGSTSTTLNIQGYHGMDYVRSTSYVTTDIKITVKRTGTYKVSWMGFRNTNSGTNGSQLYINNSAYGSAYTSFTSTYGQSVSLNNVNLTEGQTVEVRARSRSTSYYMYVGNLIIEQTS